MASLETHFPGCQPIMVSSSETTLHNLVNKIESALDHKIFALGVFLNVEGAFDNTSFEAMGKAFADHEVHFTISRWIAAMLSNRMDRAEIRGVSSKMMIRRGCPPLLLLEEGFKLNFRQEAPG
jgi:hypothetical protein